MPVDNKYERITKIKYNGTIAGIDPDTGHVVAYDEFEYYYNDTNKTYKLIRTPFSDIQRVMVMYGIREVIFNQP